MTISAAFEVKQSTNENNNNKTNNNDNDNDDDGGGNDDDDDESRRGSRILRTPAVLVLFDRVSACPNACSPPKPTQSREKASYLSRIDEIVNDEAADVRKHASKDHLKSLSRGGGIEVEKAIN